MAAANEANEEPETSSALVPVLIVLVLLFAFVAVGAVVYILWQKRKNERDANGDDDFDTEMNRYERPNAAALPDKAAPQLAAPYANIPSGRGSDLDKAKLDDSDRYVDIAEAVK